MESWTGVSSSNEALKVSRKWLVTGAAGFIGSHLVEELLRRGQQVRAFDNFSTGSHANLEDVAERVGDEPWQRFELCEGDLRSPEDCALAADGTQRVLHEAALGSVPRSVEDPATTHASNVDGTLNLLVAARDAGCERFVYASSSSVYGDDPELPKVEAAIGRPLSPYAAGKRMAELYADVFQRNYGLPCVGLRYFNVFGPRQDPEGAYAAVIPRWTSALVEGREVVVYGDGETSRDFCPVANVVQANLLAALAPAAAEARVYNVGLGGRTTLTELFSLIRDGLVRCGVDVGGVEPRHEEFRPGDVRHSLASIEAIRGDLGYEPSVDLVDGMRRTLEWFLAARSASV